MGKRVSLIVLDSAGVGWEPDADRFCLLYTSDAADEL